MQVIPLSAVASQTAAFIASDQACVITLAQKDSGTFFDLVVNGNDVVRGRIVRDRACLVLGTYKGFGGEFAMIDTQGNSDPDYTGLGSRWQLVYLT